jgi:glutathione peroxidase
MPSAKPPERTSGRPGCSPIERLQRLKPYGAALAALVIVVVLAVTGVMREKARTPAEVTADEVITAAIAPIAPLSHLAQDDGSGDGMGGAPADWLQKQFSSVPDALQDERVQAALGPVARVQQRKDAKPAAGPSKPTADQDATLPDNDPQLASAGYGSNALEREPLIAAAMSPIAVVPGGAEDTPASAPTQVADAGASTASCPPLLRYTFNRLQTGEPQSLCQYEGKVLLVVNTASYCGYTHQYEGLEAMYRKYRDRGLVVVGFPSNDFGAQEPGTNAQIAEFCRATYGVQFPMFEKSNVSGIKSNPLFTELATKTGSAPKWNFHKYVIDRDGVPVAAFASKVTPDDASLTSLIERLLAQKSGAHG